METSKVPQQRISTYSGNKKAIYATQENGEYTVVASSGWSVEEDVTRQALQELERLADTAYQSVLAGNFSPLYFHMYDRRMDLPTLAQSSGFFKWRIKRHFRPEIFKKLPAKSLARYSDALGLSKEILCTIPPQRVQENE
jgi:hypothetical protein